MKRISALLFAALLLFILAACGEDSGKHDKTFTIIVDGEDVWTPFDGDSAITFENEKDDIIELTSEGIDNYLGTYDYYKKRRRKQNRAGKGRERCAGIGGQTERRQADRGVFQSAERGLS